MNSGRRRRRAASKPRPLKRLAVATLAGTTIVAGLWLAAGLLASLEGEPPAVAALRVEPVLEAATGVVVGAEAGASTGAAAGVAAGAAIETEAGSVPTAVGTVEPGVDVAAGTAAARAGFRPDADPDLPWIGNPLATPMLIANGQMKSRPVAFRFRAGADGCVTSFRTWWRYSDPDKPESTYSGGDGGRYRVELRPDDGTGAPADEVLDAGTFTADVLRYPNDSHDNQYREVAFGGAACLRRGTTYHVVLVNVSSEPDEDFLSFNGPYLRDTFQNPAEANACPACVDHAVLRREADGSWILFPDDHTPAMVYAPFWCAALDTGVAVGQSLQYGVAAVDSPLRVSGTARVRQTFTVGDSGDSGESGESVQPDQAGKVDPAGGAGASRASAVPRVPDAPATLSFHARRLAGDAPLEVRVAGRTVGSVSMPMSAGEEPADAREFAWYDVALDEDASNAALDVEFVTAEGSVYELDAAVRTAKLCGVPVAGDAPGRAEVSTDGGATWRGPSVFGKPDKPNVQLSLVLKGRS